jgi:predicted metal-dependent enzyme (double-stranded beta helix superfamily)
MTVLGRTEGAVETCAPHAEAAITDALDGLTGRVLDTRELRTLVDRLAARPELWQGQVDFPDDRRHYVSLYRDEHVDIWLLCWTPSSDTGFHDHDLSSGAVRVVRGAVAEHCLRFGDEPLCWTATAGTSFAFGADHIHRMVGEAAASVSIHAYSPPLWRMGQYVVTTNGLLRRTSVSYAEELRPIEEETQLSAVEKAGRAPSPAASTC